HFDHIGLGGSASRAGITGQIHNGADDNASGTAAVLELARRYAARAAAGRKPARRIVFICFSAEERGLLGSRHYVKNDPLAPLDSTLAMVNFDMVGRLAKEKLIVFGTKTGEGLEPLVEKLNEKYKFQLKKEAGGIGASDHSSFYTAKIPAFHLFTGTHQDYHAPTDDADKINYDGMRRVIDYSQDLVDALVDLPERPKFTEVASDPHAGMELSGDALPYLGTIPDYGADVVGVALTGVKKDSPADKAGLKAEDVIVEFAGAPIKDVQGYTRAMQKYKSGDTVDIIVLRGKEMTRVPLKATLGTRNR
ncbi:MAG: M28 family peptidase, partial [Planctomycetia bacterium]